MPVELYEHNQKAYAAASLLAKSGKVAVIQEASNRVVKESHRKKEQKPRGCGRTGL